MNLTKRRNRNRKAFSRVQYFSLATNRLFRFLSVFMVLCGLLLLALGVLTIFSKTHSGGHFPVILPIVCFLGGVASLWARDFGHGLVIVTDSDIKTRNHIHRTARKDDINSLDIIHSDPLGSESTTPTLFLRNGRSLVLEPLIWSEQVGSEQPKWTYWKQQQVVKEIREILHVGGND